MKNLIKNVVARMLFGPWMPILFGICMAFCCHTVKGQVWSEDFEGNWTNSWHASAGVWDVDVPASGPNSAHSFQKCLATNPTGNYPGSANTKFIRDIPFQVPAASQNPRLRFWHWFSNWNDNGRVEIKVGNNPNWIQVSDLYDYTGSAAWTSPSIDLSPWADSVIQLAFRFVSDGSGSSVSSGWYIDDVEIVTGPIIFNNPENWAGGLGDWSSDNGSWEVGPPTSGPAVTHSGQNCAGTRLGGNYHGSVDSRLRSPSIVVPAASQNPRLRFWHWFSNWNDNGRVEIKVGNNPNWIQVSDLYDYTGSAAWTSPSIDLSPWADSVIQLAFRFVSDGSGSSVSSGWYIDDVEIVTGPIIFNNPENWAGGLGDWSSDNGSWEVGPPTSGPAVTHSGQNCAGTRLGGNYHGSVDSRLRSPSIVVPAASQNPRLRFWHWFSNWNDNGRVEIKVGNNPNWMSITSNFTNAGSGWTFFSVDLTPWADSILQVAFRFVSDGSGSSVSSGWYIDDIEITGLSLPLTASAGQNTTICSGSSTVLSGTVSGGAGSYSYAWSPGSGLSSTSIANPVASPTVTTTYTLTVTDGAGTIFVDSVTVFVVPFPIVDLGSDTTLASGASVTLDAGNSGASYLWSTGATTQTIMVSAMGTYWVNVSIGDCMESDTILVDVINPIDARKAIRKLEIYPNPASSFMFVEMELTRVSSIRLDLFDLQGRSIFQWQPEWKVTEINQRIDLTPYAPGFYFLLISINGETHSRNTIISN